MIKIGMHYGYWNTDWDTDIIPCVYRAAKLGFDILGVDAPTILQMGEKKRKKFKEVVNTNKLELTFCVGLSPEYDISSENKIIRECGIDFLKRNIEMISNMGGTQFSGVMFGTWNPVMLPGEIDKQACLERSINSMKEIAKTAEEFGVYCNIEPVNRFEQFMINTCEEALEYIHQINSPNVKILLDTFHMNIEEDDLEEPIIKAGYKLGHLHFGENNRKPPGMGQLNWDRVFNGLKKINYQGRVVMEPFVIRGGSIGKDIKVWREMLLKNDLDKEAIKALEFVRKGLS